MSEPLKALAEELGRTAVLSEAFKMQIMILAQQVAFEAFERGKAYGETLRVTKRKTR